MTEAYALGTVALSAFLIAFSGALVPGPVLTVTISEALRRGPFAGTYLMAGHALLEGGMVALLLLGVGPLLRLPLVSTVTGCAGAVILLIMAFSLFKTPPCLPEVRGSSPKHGSLLIKGVVMSMANPYWTIWWVTIGAGLLSSAREWGAGGVGLFYVGHVCADILWYTLVSWSVARGRSFLTSRWYRRIMVACGVMLLFFSLWFAKNAFTALVGST